MHLYTNSSSPNGRRVNVFLKEKGIQLPATEIDLRGAENLSEDFLQKNPFGLVPVLELDDGSFLAESQAICRLLEGLHPDPNLFGESAVEQAMVEMWCRRVEMNYLVSVAQGFRNSTGFFKDRERCSAEWGSISVERAQDFAERIDRHLADHQYLAGGRYTVADLVLAVIVGFASVVGQKHLELANLGRHHAEVTARPSFQ